MERNEKEHIRKNLYTLMCETKCNHGLIALLFAQGFLGQADKTKLESIADPSDRSYHLYGIIVTKTDAFLGLTEALQKDGQSGAAAILLKFKRPNSQPLMKGSCRTYRRKMNIMAESDSVTRKVKNIANHPFKTFGVKAPSVLFTGREVELEQLHELIMKHIDKGRNSSSECSQITFVIGLGGIGKTQLARRYIQKYSAHFDNNVICIDAENEESLMQSFRLLARDVLGISTKNADGNDKHVLTIVRDCYEQLSGRNCLFVFDNAEKGEYFEKYLPSSSTSCTTGRRHSILITSRNRECGNNSGNVLNLHVFQEKDAINFVKFGLKGKYECDQDEDISRLASTLQYFPLALRQAVSYIENQRLLTSFAIGDYLAQFEAQADLLLDCPVSPGIFTDYRNTTLSTWQISIDKILSSHPLHGSLAVELLQLAAYLSPDRIPCDIFHGLLNRNPAADNKSQLNEALRLLIEYSMVDIELVQGDPTVPTTLSIQRLMQQVMRIQIRRSDKEVDVLRKALSLFVELANADLPTDSPNIELGNKLLELNVSHAMSAWEYAKKYKGLVAEFSSLPTAIILVTTACLRFEEGVKFVKENIELLERTLGAYHTQFIDTMVAAGKLFTSCGKFDKAADLLAISHQRHAQLLGEMHPFSLEILYNVAVAVKSQRNYFKAFDMLTKLGHDLQDALGESHPLALESFSLAAETGCRIMRFEQANEAMERVLKVKTVLYRLKKIGILDIYKTARIRAVVKAEMGLVDGVIMLRALYSELSKQAESPQFDEIRQSVLYNLSVFLYHFKCYKEGFQMANELYDIRKGTLGESHVHTLNTLERIGLYLLQLGKTDQALLAIRHAYSKIKEIFGENGYRTIGVYDSFGLALSRKGKHAHARIVYAEIFDRLGNMAEVPEISMLELKINFAEVLENAGCQVEAVQILEKVGDVFREQCGEAKPPLYLDCLEAIMRLRKHVAPCE